MKTKIVIGLKKLTEKGWTPAVALWRLVRRLRAEVAWYSDKGLVSFTGQGDNWSMFLYLGQCREVLRPDIRAVQLKIWKLHFSGWITGCKTTALERTQAFLASPNIKLSRADERENQNG